MGKKLILKITIENVNLINVDLIYHPLFLNMSKKSLHRSSPAGYNILL
jgi:hypothetical protein